MEQQSLFPELEPERRPRPAQEIADTYQARFAETLRLLHRNQFAAALPHGQRAAELDASNPDAIFACAVLHYELGQHDLAAELLDETRMLLRFRPFGFTPDSVSRLHALLQRARGKTNGGDGRERRTRAKGTPAAKKRATPPAASRPAAVAAPAAPVAAPTLPVTISEPVIALATDGAPSDPSTALTDYRLRLGAQEVDRLRGYDTLLALREVYGVDHYEYQLRTVRRVLREFRGRVLLADEVGLGKTIEACLCLKEYLLRGLARSVLAIVPAPLCQQWQDELLHKFALPSRRIEREDLAAGAPALRGAGVHVVSLALARQASASAVLAEVRFDLVIVDEAHRLKNRKTRSWQLVDRLRSRYLMLLSATPIENDLVEIYNVLTLLKPGLFSTEAEFKRAFASGKSRLPKDPARLRALLREVMVRNTRAVVDAPLPPRFATTLRADPGPAEAELHARVDAAVRAAVRAGTLALGGAGEVLRMLGSAPVAAADALARWLGPELGDAARALARDGAVLAKDRMLLDLLARRRGEKVLLFAGSRATLDHVLAVLLREGHRAVLFHGSLDRAAKEAAIAAFAGDAEVLVASESGGEGFNMQFARTVVNYDLPWNPMRIEQRIGRVHRIGQTREVFVFNLVNAGTIEQEVLRVLDEKINMFELVVGEIDAILGRLGDDERDFQELVLELYARAEDPRAARAAFDELAAQLVAARGEYDRVKAFEQSVLGEDLGA
jgi:superfamily II DNA or RNA helicase